jgi:hypothetical protein
VADAVLNKKERRYAFAMIQKEERQQREATCKTLRDGNPYKMLRLLCLTLPQREQRSNVRNVLQSFE